MQIKILLIYKLQIITCSISDKISIFQLYVIYNASKLYCFYILPPTCSEIIKLIVFYIRQFTSCYFTIYAKVCYMSRSKRITFFHKVQRMGFLKSGATTFCVLNYHEKPLKLVMIFFSDKCGKKIIFQGHMQHNFLPIIIFYVK